MRPGIWALHKQHLPQSEYWEGGCWSDPRGHFFSSYFQLCSLRLAIKVLADKDSQVLDQKLNSENFYALSKSRRVWLGLWFLHLFHRTTIYFYSMPDFWKISLEMTNMLHCKWHHLTICRCAIFKFCVNNCTYCWNPFHQPVLFSWVKTSDFCWQRSQTAAVKLQPQTVKNFPVWLKVFHEWSQHKQQYSIFFFLNLEQNCFFSFQFTYI